MKKMLSIFLAVAMALGFWNPLAGAAVSLRKVRVQMVVSPGFRAQPDWKSEFQQRLTYASRIFESEFKIELVPVRYKAWPGVDKSEEPRVLLEDLRSKFPQDDVDIEIGRAHV